MSDLSFSTDEYLDVASISLRPSIGNNELVNGFIDARAYSNLRTLSITSNYALTDIKIPTAKDSLYTYTLLGNQELNGVDTLSGSVDFDGYTNLQKLIVSANTNFEHVLPQDINNYSNYELIQSSNGNIKWDLPSNKTLPNNLRDVDINGNNNTITGALPTNIPTAMYDFKIIGNNNLITGQPPALPNTFTLQNYRVFGANCAFDGTDFIKEPSPGLRWYQVANESGNVGTHEGEVPQFNNSSNLVVFNFLGCKLTGTQGPLFTQNMHTTCPQLKIFKIGGRGTFSPNYHGSLGTVSVPRFGEFMETLVMTNLRNGNGSPLITGFTNDCFDDSGNWSIIDLRYNNMSTATIDILINRLYDIYGNTPTIKLEGSNHPTVDDPGQTTFNLNRRTSGDEGADTGNLKVNAMIDAGFTFTANSSGSYSWIN